MWRHSHVTNAGSLLYMWFLQYAGFLLYTQQYSALHIVLRWGDTFNPRPQINALVLKRPEKWKHLTSEFLKIAPVYASARSDEIAFVVAHLTALFHEK